MSDNTSNLSGVTATIVSHAQPLGTTKTVMPEQPASSGRVVLEQTPSSTSKQNSQRTSRFVKPGRGK